ncbi:Major cardiolipin synthase ClsA [Candidatus Izimaplasma bacterium HR1]|jgi:cardiolipin synthase|uniref:cardiolipin synthase n=1 Tax=Candidatus Izimoplasma sp. HR1 TaxID=1541959 RepID=UPI0004F7A880|nr:Major cardiolipin synthase ClsA [Candidatus Izimaplasma bacterium HR1]
MRFNLKRNIWVVIIIIVMLLIRYGFEYALRLFELEVTFAESFNIVARYFITFMSIIVFIHIIGKSDYSISKLPWMLILIIEPLTGLTIFLTFGRDYRESSRYRRHSKIHNGKYLTHEPDTNFNKATYKAIDSEITDIYKTSHNMTKHHAYLYDSKVEVINNGEDFFIRLAEEIKNAKKFIFLQFYIIRTDKTGRMILDLLKEKALEGIEVKVQYDAIGSVFLNQRYLKKIEECGVEIKEFDPVFFAFFDTKMNYRNHRKNVIIDGKVAFTGGMNLADEYQNKARSKRFPRFRDTQIAVTGKAINSLTALFLRDWYYITNDFITDKKYYCAEKVESQGMVEIIPSGPDYKYPPIRNTYVKMINNAKVSIKIITPYLALDREMVTSLMIAARGGVNVEIIVPGTPDKKSVYEVTKSFFNDLLEEGVKIYTYTNTFCHAKVFIIDDMIASCGTYNLDNRSARINFEVTALLYNTGVKELVKDFKIDLTKSKEVLYSKWKKRSRVQRLFEGFIGIMSPLV